MPTTPNPSFPKPQVSALLNSWYDAEMNSSLRRPRAPADARKKGGTVFDIQPEMSSTKAVNVLLDLAAILGFEPSKSVIKKGGYANKQEFVQGLTNCAEDAFTQHYAPGPSHSPNKKETNLHAQV